jgi:hypothetical protein
MAPERRSTGGRSPVTRKTRGLHGISEQLGKRSGKYFDLRRCTNKIKVKAKARYADDYNVTIVYNHVPI